VVHVEIDAPASVTAKAPASHQRSEIIVLGAEQPPFHPRNTPL
jgi:hypothetical protein